MTLFLSGCGNTGKILIQKDNLEGKSIISLLLISKADEKIYSTEYPAEGFFRYSREAGAGGMSPVRIYLTMNVSTLNEELSEKAFLKLNSEMLPVRVTDRSSEVRSELYRNTVRPWDIDTKTWKELRGVIELSAEAENKLRTSSGMIIRLYSGPDPVTFTIKGNDLAKIKNSLPLKTGEWKRSNRRRLKSMQILHSLLFFTFF
jgi:hypothetical protein